VAKTNLLREAHSTYTDARGWAMGASTLRVRWRLRRLPRRSTDQQQAAAIKALRDELRERGVEAP